MFDEKSIGHTETQFDIPDPLGSSRFWNPLTSGLPANVLSWVSILVLGVVFLFPLADAQMRSLFQLPVDPVWLTGAAALLAGWVLLSSRNRPGRLFPRFWALLLTSLSAGVFALGLAAPLTGHGDHPCLHLTSLALLASAVSLLPRLVRIRPDSAWLQRIAPASCLAVLVFVLPASYAAGLLAIAEEDDAVAGVLAQIEGMTATVREAAGHDWSRMWDGKPAAREKLESLEKLAVPDAYDDPEFWDVVETLGKTAELKEAVQGLTNAVVGGLDPEVTPKLSASPEPAIWWEPDLERWQEDSAFPELSSFVGRYHETLGRLFQDLEVADSAARQSEPLGLVAAGHQSAQGTLVHHLTAALEMWSDHWAVFRLPGHNGLIGVSEMETDDLLVTPITGGQHQIVPARLWDLLHLPLSEGRTLGAEIPGCHPREYEKGEYLYHRIDCYTYLPGTNGNRGADLRLDMRIVYRLGYGLPLGQHLLPAEVYFLFPIPPETSPATFQKETMAGFRDAVAQNWSGSIMNRDTGGSTMKGFILKKDRDSLAVVANVEDHNFKYDFLVVRAYVN